MAEIKEKRQRAKRRNFVAERQQVVGFCKFGIQIVKDLSNIELPADTRNRLTGKLDTYQEILKMMGEAGDAA